MPSIQFTFPADNAVTSVLAETLVLLTNHQTSFQLHAADGSETDTTAVLTPNVGHSAAIIASALQDELPDGTSYEIVGVDDPSTLYVPVVGDTSWDVSASTAPTFRLEASPLSIELTEPA